MPTIQISGLGPPLDGEYVLDLNFTYRDFRDIKRIAGARANEVEEAMEAGDLDMVIALASIALRRAGVVHDPEILWEAEAPAGITLTFEKQEMEEAGDSPQPSADETRNGGDGGASGISTSSATDSSQETSTPPHSGIPQPEGTSDPATLMR